MTTKGGEQDCQKGGICLITTEASFASTFLGPHIKQWALGGSIVVLGRGKYIPQSNERFVSIPIQRKPNIFYDISCLFVLVKELRRINPDVIITLMPKAGLLGQLAGLMSGISVRVHIFTGQVWASKNGLTRSALIWFDKFISRTATSILTDSHSQRRVIVETGITPHGKVDVLGNGSISGVDTARFCPDEGRRAAERKNLGIGDGDFVYLFLGRLCADKGIGAFLEMAVELKSNSNLHFVIAGHDEEDWRTIIEKLQLEGVRAKYVGYRPDSENILRAADVLVLPSAREGFGSVVIEAGACCIPVLSTDIYGLMDSVIDGVNGLKFSLGDSAELCRLGWKLSVDTELRIRLGLNGRERAVKLFDQKLIVHEWCKYFENLRRRDTC